MKFSEAVTKLENCFDWLVLTHVSINPTGFVKGTEVAIQVSWFPPLDKIDLFTCCGDRTVTVQVNRIGKTLEEVINNVLVCAKEKEQNLLEKTQQWRDRLASSLENLDKMNNTIWNAKVSHKIQLQKEVVVVDNNIYNTVANDVINPFYSK